MVLDCGRPSAPATSPTVAARLFSRKYSRIAKARSADLTAAPDAGFDLAGMPKTHQLTDLIVPVCGSEVYDLRQQAFQNMNSPPLTWIT
ncbi:MAG: hypothetical protein ACLP8B_05040 [Xanthobacteraceae bacterium]